MSAGDLLTRSRGAGLTSGLGRLLRLRETGLVVALVVVSAVLEVLRPQFLSAGNLEAMLLASATLAIVSAGMALVILLAGIDISVGSVLGVVAFFVGEGMLLHWSPVLIVAMAMAVGAAFGFLNGLIIHVLRVPAIVATLGTMSIWSAASFYLLNGEWLSGLPPVFGWIVNGTVLGVPAALLLILVVYALMLLLLTRTRFGRDVYAIGNNETAARLNGISSVRVGVLAYTVVGVLVGIASIVYTAVNGNVEIQAGADLPLTAIAAAVLGGVDILGGAGNIVGVLLGVAFIAVLQNGAVLLGVPSLYNEAVIGAIILLSVGVDLSRRRRARRSGGM
jgi:ribose/xylose/arabinose/galactoside ABC-type transport system permease subunit